MLLHQSDAALISGKDASTAPCLGIALPGFSPASEGMVNPERAAEDGPDTVQVTSRPNHQPTSLSGCGPRLSLALPGVSRCQAGSGAPRDWEGSLWPSSPSFSSYPHPRPGHPGGKWNRGTNYGAKRPQAMASRTHQPEELRREGRMEKRRESGKRKETRGGS